MKKGYFFTLDAFIAMTMLIVCVVLVFSFYSSKPYPMQSIFLSDDLMRLLSTTHLYELQNNYYLILYRNGNITQTDNTVLEQIAWFYISGRPTLAERFAINITSTMVPEKYGFQLRIYNESREYNTTINTGQASEDSARLITTSKRIILGVNNNTPWGPMIAEVKLWQ